MANYVVDQSSGQVYTETEMMPALAASRGTSWVHESPHLPIGWEEINARGSASLKHCAMRGLLSDQRRLDVETFKTVPWHIAQYLWKYLGRCKKRTFYMWKIYATVYPDEFREISDYRSMKIEGPKMPFRDYLDLARSDSLSWGLALTVVTKHARVPELVDIATLKNLVALDVISPLYGETIPEDPDLSMDMLNDRVIRTWSELAQSSGSFAHLHTLRLYHQKDISAVALRYLRDIPSLRYIMVHNCPNIARSSFDSGFKACGWESLADPQLLALSSLVDYYRSGTRDLQSRRDPGTIDPDIPLLNYQIGQTNHRSTKVSKVAQTIVLKARPISAMEGPGPVAKKPKGSQDAAGSGGRRGMMREGRRGVMRERRGQDLQGVLEDLL